MVERRPTFLKRAAAEELPLMATSKAELIDVWNDNSLLTWMI